MRREHERRVVAGAACLALVTLAAGCSHSLRPSAPARPPRPPQPQSAQAVAVASEEFGLLAGGGWAQAWNLWTDSAHRAVTRADFVQFNTECRPVLGVPYVIDTSTAVDRTTVRVSWHRADATGSNTLVYQAGTWRFVPDPGSLADYRPGVAALVRQRKAAGSCH